MRHELEKHEVVVLPRRFILDPVASGACVRSFGIDTFATVSPAEMAPIGDPPWSVYYRVMPRGARKARSFRTLHSSGANNLREHAPRMMIKRMPQANRPLLWPRQTPHFIDSGFALDWDAQVRAGSYKLI